MIAVPRNTPKDDALEMELVLASARSEAFLRDLELERHAQIIRQRDEENKVEYVVASAACR